MWHVFMLAPKLARLFLTARGSIRHGSVKLPGSPSFWGRFLCIIAEHSSLSLTEEAAFLSPSLLGSPSVRLSVVGCVRAGKGGSCVLIHDRVVVAKVGALGSGVSLLLIVERIWEYCSCNSLRCWTSISLIPLA
ncbi:hypothetical protein Tco_1194028 [Tanacetum coccineum]